jgi:hypothetical protein
VAVVPVDSLGHFAHFGGSFIEIGAVLTEISVFSVRIVKNEKNCKKIENCNKNR